MAPLSLQMRDEISRSKPYGNHELTPLGWTFVAQFSDGAARITAENGAAYTLSERPINHGLWKLVLLDDEAPTRQTALIIGAMSGLASIVALLAAGLVEQRRRAIKQRLANQAALQAANDMLEIRVQERTAELRAAQDDLVHAGKLAALGQMSAGMVHELNQPLAALQTAADNAILLVDRGSIGDARGNLTRIGELVRRLGRLTGQLRIFAYKSSSPLDAVSVEQAVAESLKILAARVKEGGVDRRRPTLTPTLCVVADQTRLEQLLCNIVANALDAVESVERKSILIRATGEERADRPLPHRHQQQRSCNRVRCPAAHVRAFCDDQACGQGTRPRPDALQPHRALLWRRTARTKPDAVRRRICRDPSVGWHIRGHRMSDDQSIGVIYVEDDDDVRIGGVQALELAGFSVSGFASVEIRQRSPFAPTCRSSWSATCACAARAALNG